MSHPVGGIGLYSERLSLPFAYSRFVRRVLLAGALLCLGAGPAAARPWPARAPTVEPKPAHQLRDPATWPAEPEVPAPIDAVRFQAAYAHLCGVRRRRRPGRLLAAQILTAADAAKSDPFTLAALGYFGSHCDPGFHKGGLYGLLAIDPSMYRVPGAPELSRSISAI